MIRGAAYSICHLMRSVPKEVFHNGSNYDYHFIVKELAEEFNEQFTCLEANTETIHNIFSSIRKRSYKN